MSGPINIPASVRLIPGPKFLTGFWGPLAILLCLHQLYYGWILIQSDFVPYVMDGNETFSVFWHAHNLYNYSFWKSFGLTDEAFSSAASAHPFLHTHQGNMPRLFGFLIYALGARTVPAQVAITVLIIGNLTLLFCYAAVARLTRPLIAFVFCLFLFSDYLLYAQWHVVTYRVWYGFLFFGTLYAISETKPDAKAVWPYALLGGLFFLLFYFELVFAIYLSIVCGLFAIWQHWREPRKIVRLFATQSIGGILALALLLFQLVSVFGLDVVATDFRATFLARNALGGADPNILLEEFFKNHNIVFWQNISNATALRTVEAFIKSLSVPIFQVWTPTLLVLFVVGFLGILISFFEPLRDQGKAAGSSGLRLATAVIYIFSIVLVFAAVRLPVAVYGMHTVLDAPKDALISKLAISGILIALAGLAVGCYWRLPVLIASLRGVLMGSLAAALIANNSSLYDQSYSDIWMALFQRSEIRLAVKFVVFITALAAMAIAAIGADRALGPEAKGPVGRAMIFIAIGLLAYAVIYFLSPGYVMTGYANRLAPFAIFFIVAVPAIAISGLIFAVRRVSSWLSSRSSGDGLAFARRIVMPICLALLIGAPAALWARVQIYYAQLFPPTQASFAKVLTLPEFKNGTFAVNNYAAVVAYYAGTWAYMDLNIAGAQVAVGMKRLVSSSSIWFADWKSNPQYANPTYYVCMKTPTFDSVLALQDPKRFGDRFRFCAGEAVLKEHSPFQDKLVAGDSKPPKYWSVVALAPARRPQVVDIVASVKRDGDSLKISHKVEAMTDPAYPVQATDAELVTAQGVHQCELPGAALRTSASTNGSDFVLPKDFNGSFLVRARVQSGAGPSEWSNGDTWIADPSAVDARDTVHRCAATIVDGSFGDGGLALQGRGWSTPEPTGTWSDGGKAELLPIPIREAIRNKDLILRADVIPFIAKPGQTQIVRVLGNGKVVANWLFTDTKHERIASVLIPREIIIGHKDLSLSFEIPNAASPFSFGHLTDVRKLGIHLKSISLKELQLKAPETRDTYVSMGPDALADSVATAGWDPPVNGSVAALDQTASVLVPVPNQHFSKASIVIDADVIAARDGAQPTIEVAVDGAVVGKLQNGRAQNQFALPERTYSHDDRVLVELRSSQAQGPAVPLNTPLPVMLRGIRIDSAP